MNFRGWVLVFGLGLGWTIEGYARDAPPAEDVRNADPFEVAVEEIVPGIHVVSRPISTRQPVVGNGAIIVNDDHVVVVDGAGSPHFAERVVEIIRSLTDRPVRYLVVTHWHGDHHLGTHRFIEAWPDLVVIGQRFTRAAMLGAPMDYLAEARAGTAGQLDAVAGWVESGLGPDGEPLEVFQIRELGDIVRHRDAVLADLDDSRVTPPHLTFGKSLTLRSGERTVEIRHAGKGNTAGDAFVWLPDDGVLISGDLIVLPTPYGFYSYPASWTAVLGQIEELPVRHLVPGHGPVQRDLNAVRRMRALLTDIAAQARAAVDRNEDLETFQAELDVEDHRQAYTGGDPWLDSRWRVWFVRPIATAAWNEAAGVDNEPLERTPAR